MPRMNLYNNFIVAPISRALGAVVTGIDLSKQLEPSQVSEVRDVLNEFLVLFFRDQTLTVVDQRTLVEYFGNLIPHLCVQGGSGRSRHLLHCSRIRRGLQSG